MATLEKRYRCTAIESLSCDSQLPHLHKAMYGMLPRPNARRPIRGINSRTCLLACGFLLKYPGMAYI